MRKRNVHVQFWLDKKEAEAFNKKVKRSGLSREAYLRHLVNGLVPQDAPPPAYYDFMRELHRIGGNLNQIAQKAHVLGVIDERRYTINFSNRINHFLCNIIAIILVCKPIFILCRGTKIVLIVTVNLHTDRCPDGLLYFFRSLRSSVAYG